MHCAFKATIILSSGECVVLYCVVLCLFRENKRKRGLVVVELLVVIIIIIIIIIVRCNREANQIVGSEEAVAGEGLAHLL